MQVPKRLGVWERRFSIGGTRQGQLAKRVNTCRRNLSRRWYAYSLRRRVRAEWATNGRHNLRSGVEKHVSTFPNNCAASHLLPLGVRTALTCLNYPVSHRRVRETKGAKRTRSGLKSILLEKRYPPPQRLGRQLERVLFSAETLHAYHIHICRCTVMSGHLGRHPGRSKRPAMSTEVSSRLPCTGKPPRWHLASAIASSQAKLPLPRNAGPCAGGAWQHRVVGR